MGTLQRQACPAGIWRTCRPLGKMVHQRRRGSKRCPLVHAAQEAPAEKAAADVPEGVEDKSDEYTDVMQQRMGTSLTYRHEDGMNYNRILDDLIVGSCLQTPQDADTLAETEGVATVLSLQEDCDMAWFGLDLSPIQARCSERGDIKHCRFPIRDFDPFSLRQRLPGAVALLAKQARSNGGTAYVHCTAGLGRAPATALAYMWWVKGMPLEEAYEHLRSIRPCSPKLFAIRQAAVDLLYGGPPTPVTIAVHRRGVASSIQVAGLDVGWGQQIDMELDPVTHRFVLRRELPPGMYQFKFIMDGRWTYSIDHNTVQDGDNLNNWLAVEWRDGVPDAAAARERLLKEGGQFTEAEQQRIRDLVEELGEGGSASSSIGTLDAWHVGWSAAAAEGNGAAAADGS